MNSRLNKFNKKSLLCGMALMGCIVVLVFLSSFKVNAGKYNDASVNYTVYVAQKGWTRIAKDGQTAGKIGETIEAFKINLEGNFEGDIVYQTYIDGHGWQEEVKNDMLSGRINDYEELEAIKIRLQGDVQNKYDVVYRVYLKEKGWSDWTYNGDMAGSDTEALRIEAIEIKLNNKNGTQEERGQDNDAVVYPIETANPIVTISPIETAYPVETVNPIDNEDRDDNTNNGTSGKVNDYFEALEIIDHYNAFDYYLENLETTQNTFKMYAKSNGSSPQWKTASMSTKKAYRYGTFEFTYRLSSNDIYLWPMIWTLPNGEQSVTGNRPEFDLLESWGSYTNNSHVTTTHVYLNGEKKSFQSSTPVDLTKEHTIKMVWEPTYVEFYLDGKKTLTVTEGLKDYYQVFIVGLGVGTYDGKAPNGEGWFEITDFKINAKEETKKTLVGW